MSYLDPMDQQALDVKLEDITMGYELHTRTFTVNGKLSINLRGKFVAPLGKLTVTADLKDPNKLTVRDSNLDLI